MFSHELIVPDRFGLVLNLCEPRYVVKTKSDVGLMMRIIARTDVTTTMTANTSYLSFKLMPVFLTRRLFFLVDDIVSKVTTEFFYGQTR